MMRASIIDHRASEVDGDAALSAVYRKNLDK